ncbi:MAG TPA: hypothetical protein VM223_00055 [Planctomycetota bacterium]|nr:hypothetical protein [Planctomycetota bacterium]
MSKQIQPVDDHTKTCADCCGWVFLSDLDGGIGICDDITSDHAQHVLGRFHPMCAAALEAATATVPEAGAEAGDRRGLAQRQEEGE